LRLKANDRPGVLAAITSALRDEGISVEALIQKEPRKGEQTVNLVLISSRCREKVINSAIASIENMDVVDGQVVKIRVETLD
ncbi:MAG: ACT domain-containing protein, partial [Pseudomonadales bacterium]|nr:ACT domain-containing protein [Pseudomonadales bacterium]